MKKVDENYNYDELEGFVPMKTGQKSLREERIQMGTHRQMIVFTKAAIEALGDPDYVAVSINRERKQILIKKSDYMDDEALRIRSRAKVNRVKNVTENKNLEDEIEQMTNRDLGTVNLIIDGVKARTVRDAVIFDLRTVRTEKKRIIGAAIKKAKAAA